MEIIRTTNHDNRPQTYEPVAIINKMTAPMVKNPSPQSPFAQAHIQEKKNAGQLQPRLTASCPSLTYSRDDAFTG